MAGSDKDNLMRKTKTFLRSTLLSNKGCISIFELDRDYKKLVGDFIPYAQLNFPDLETFLSSLPNVCSVSCEGGEVVVRGVAGKASSHIKDMVARQKTKSVGGKRSGGYKGWGGYSGGGRPGFKYNSFNFDMSDGSDWENYNIKAKVGERARLENAVPAGFEDTDDEDFDDFSAFSSVPNTTTVEVTNNLSDQQDSGPSQTNSSPGDDQALSIPLCGDEVSLGVIHTGPLPPSPLTMYTTYTDILVSQASSPSQFSVQPLHSRDLYHTLAYQMDRYYNTSPLHTVHLEKLVPGYIVVARHSGSWFRAEVIKFLRSHLLVCLKLVDTGKIILSTSMEDIQPLWTVFAELPVQAASCTLAGVKPSRGGSWWQVETDWFRKVVLGKDWVGVIKKVVNGGQEGPVLVIRMYDVSQEDHDYEVGEDMIRMGLALPE